MVRKAAQTPVPGEDLPLIDEAKEVFAGDIVAMDDVYTDANGNTQGLHVRIARIIQSLPDVQPEGRNEHFKYRFITDKQVLGLLRPRLSRQRIIVIPETVEERDPIELTTAKGGRSLLSRITVTWRVVDGITGESFTGQSVGYGDDSGDKGANKAFTAALKNYFLKLFEIGGDTDLEEDEEADKRAKSRSSGSERVESVVIGDANIEGVERGGKASQATEAQITRVGQYARDLQLDANGLGGVIHRVLEKDVPASNEPWQAIKITLESLTGKQIGALIAALDDLYQTASGSSDDEPSPSGY